MKIVYTIIIFLILALGGSYWYESHQPIKNSSGHYFTVSGGSMNPTLVDQQTVSYHPDSQPKVNDVIIFNYSSVQSSPVILVKRLLKIDGGNWWVEGDNKDHSYDSRAFGWVTPIQRTFIGVVDPFSLIRN